MEREIRLISTDFDGTLVAHDFDPVLDHGCMELLGELKNRGAQWAINTGRSVQLLESGLLDFDFPVHRIGRNTFAIQSKRIHRSNLHGDIASQSFCSIAIDSA